MGTALSTTVGGSHLWQRCNTSASDATRLHPRNAELFSSVLMWCAAEHLLRMELRAPPKHVDWAVLHGTPLASARRETPLSTRSILSVPSVGEGFWVRANVVLAHALWALSVGIALTTANMKVDLAADRYAAADTDHPWGAFFRPVGDDAHGEAVQLDCTMAVTAFEAFKPYRQGYAAATAARARHAELVTRLGIAPRPELVAIANHWWHTRVVASTPGRQLPALGVHMRGTDARHDLSRNVASRYVLILLRRFVRLARAFCCAHPGAVVVAAGDELPLLQLLRQHLSSSACARVVWREEATRSIDQRPVHSRSGSTTGSARRALAVDAVVDSLLLGRCAYLLKAQSSLSEWSILLNPGLLNATYDAGLRDQPMPAWSGEACSPKVKILP